MLKEAISNSNKYEEVVNFVGLRISNKKNKFSQEMEKRPAR
jgi:hypothetical protein